eukprot:CAMPEP_0182426166 /NCGR_PEP_ID=MMETSP1167-20130531/12652_1 /TAXON_ID=2988 /ORGANISM="Mallomonas Sp, Strain CCMP3275" /LENGTH=366 /DNA_ID=CAMNT_0024607411 /DNA_START=61 /DNA_END=1158 /DNA_ORIENTATION=+
MSNFVDEQRQSDSYIALNETEDDMECRHNQELKDLEEQIRKRIKQASKSKKADVEKEGIQMKYALRAKHLEEIELFEENGQIKNSAQETAHTTPVPPKLESLSLSTPSSVTGQDLEQQRIADKKAKAKRKKEKKIEKEEQRQQQKEQIRLNLPPEPSRREIEIECLNKKLEQDGLKIQEMPADGHCMYRSIVYQLSQLSDHDRYSLPLYMSMFVSLVIPYNSDEYVMSLRNETAKYMRDHRAEYAPFIESIETEREKETEKETERESGQDEEEEKEKEKRREKDFSLYCDSVQSMQQAVWGGQLELRAISSLFKREIHVYSADSPTLRMGEGVAKEGAQPLRVTYHRHFYALGEHYNSTISKNKKW